jgi:hypothetical protein
MILVLKATVVLELPAEPIHDMVTLSDEAFKNTCMRFLGAK